MNTEVNQPIINIHGAFPAIWAQSEQALRTDPALRSQVISSFLSFLAITSRNHKSGDYSLTLVLEPGKLEGALKAVNVLWDVAEHLQAELRPG